MAEQILHIPVRLARLPKDGHHLSFTFSDRERESLAKLHDLVALPVLEAEIDVVKIPKGVEVRGRIRGDVVQSCVVTNEPLEDRIDSEFVVRFVQKPVVHGQEIEFSVLDEDEEPFPGDEADLGGIVEEYFALALDPYPRKEGTSFEHIEDDEPSPAPFAELAKLKAKKSTKS